MNKRVVTAVAVVAVIAMVAVALGVVVSTALAGPDATTLATGDSGRLWRRYRALIAQVVEGA